MRNDFYNDFDRTTRDAASHGRGSEGEYRTPFQIDRDRIIHTSAFRRLQSKTQVFLSGEYDFYRTRLTHSIEVAQIGRSICTRLRVTDGRLGPECFIDPDLVEAACLAHDIGHPPFGHTGERTLHRLMKPWGGFEGNAQTLRMLTRTIFSRQQNGMNPTRGFMDAVLKYKSLFSDLDDPPNHFLYSDQAGELDFVLGGLGFPKELKPGKVRDGFRSIECQIMDWADDTAYSLNDVADGINAGFITIAKVERWAEETALTGDDATHIEDLVKTIRNDRVEGRINRKIGAFIAAADLREAENFLSETTRRYSYRLEIQPEIAAECALYKQLSLDLVFRSQQLQQLDKKADFILSRLFGAFAELYIVPDSRGPDHFKLLSEPEERRIFKEAKDETARARVVCDAIARMTDGVAARTYKRLFDADFGSIVDLV
jgi:dGTPase